MSKYIMALDQGTTSSRCVIYDESFNIVIKVQKEFEQIYPKPSYVEHDPMVLWSTQMGVCQEAMLKINASHKDIIGIGITNQRETTILWDKLTGKPVYNAIVWQCRRTSSYCDELINKGYEELIKTKTGLKIDPYFSATKIKWILDNVKNARKLASEGRLLFGTVDSWLLWKLTNGKVHATDYSNASRTMLFNINTLSWDDELLELFNIPKSILPEVKDSYGSFGETNILGGNIKILGILGDQMAALYGQRCFNLGDVKNTYGTGCFLLMNIGDKPIIAKNGLLTTIAWKIKDKIIYALEGSIFVAGAAIQWLRDEMKLIDSASESSDFAKRVENNGGVYLVPAFQGLGTPYWDYKARGSILGLTRASNKYHIIRATLEAIAYQTKDVIDIMEENSNIKINILKVDGGASLNDFLMQFQADMLQTSVIRPKNIESTSLGAAMIASYGLINKEDIEFDFFKPSINKLERDNLYSGWKNAIDHTKNWLE